MRMVGVTMLTAGFVLVSPVHGKPSKTPGIELGRRVYRKACLACHGARGDGKGRAARAMNPRPRDFTLAVYKFRSRPTGELPTDEDLFRTISRGVRGTAMPSWERHLSVAERRAVVQYIKTFSSEFAQEDDDAEKPLTIGKPPPLTAKLLVRGKQLFVKNKCGRCHGAKGRGDGPASKTLKDDKGRRIRANDMTRGQYRGGGSPKDLYRTIATGVAGTPMPTYENIAKQDLWALVFYVKSLETNRGFLDYLFGARVSWDR